jgi:phage-related baseplate assembly protein
VSDPTLAEKDVATVLAEALARYKETTGVTLAPADPRRLHLQAFLLLLAQQRQLIDFAGKQSLLRFVSDDWIDILAELWGEERIAAAPSTCTVRFSYEFSLPRTVPAGTRVTDGTNLWRVTEDTSETDDEIDVPVECLVTGSATNGLAPGQIDTLVDPDNVPGCTGVSNTTETISGRNIESLEAFRERLRDVPESRSTCGPRTAYRAAALEASSSVADAVALGPNDGDEMAGYAPDPGEVFVLIIKGERDADDEVVSVVPEPDSGLLTTVEEALSAEDVRPLTDSVTVKSAEFVDLDVSVGYYIARSRSDSATQIQGAVQAAYDAYLLWQQSKIGRDINPSELTTRLVNAGAKRANVISPAFTALSRDEVAKLRLTSLAYLGVEDD